MIEFQRIKNLSVPTGRIDVVLDTDAYNEIDDQFAIAYMLRSDEMLDVKAIYAAPFHNEKSVSPDDGMEKSYDEILKVLDLAGRADLKDKVYRGSRQYLPAKDKGVVSDAASDLAERAMKYSEDKPLYVVAIGAITNVASAILMKPEIADKIVIVWLGGHGLDYKDTMEFNMRQDFDAARVVFDCGAPLVVLPCMGVVSEFRTTKPELEYWLMGKNPLADYLAKNAIAEAESYAKGKPWSRVIWDVTAVAWLLNDNDRFMESRLEHSFIPEHDGFYAFDASRHFIRYVYQINRDALMEDLFNKICKQ